MVRREAELRAEHEQARRDLQHEALLRKQLQERQAAEPPAVPVEGVAAYVYGTR